MMKAEAVLSAASPTDASIQLQILTDFSPANRWQQFHSIHQRSDLSGLQKHLFAVLLGHINTRTGLCCPSLARLARLMSRCVNTVKKALAGLIEAGLVRLKGGRLVAFVLSETIQRPADDQTNAPIANDTSGDNPVRHDMVPPEVPIQVASLLRHCIAERQDGLIRLVPRSAFAHDMLRRFADAIRLHYARHRLRVVLERPERVAA